jgi:hypothetical protein
LTVQPLPHAAFPHEPRRARKLLLHAKEIDQIRKSVDHDKKTLIPLRIYLKNGLIKTEIALATGKKKGDKREAIKTREAAREGDVGHAPRAQGVTGVARVTWQGGGGASIETLENDRITLVSNRAFAPGSRPEGTLQTKDVPETGGHRIWVKVHGSRKQEDGIFPRHRAPPQPDARAPSGSKSRRSGPDRW